MIGAIVFRAIFVLAGTALLSTFSWLVFVFGAFLIFTGFRMFCRGNDDGKQIDYQNNRVLSLFRRFVTLTKDYYTATTTSSSTTVRPVRSLSTVVR